MNQSSRKGLSYATVIAILVIAVVAAVVKYSFKKTDETASNTETTSTESPIASDTSANASPSQSTDASSNSSSSTYKDGVYTATGSYVSPGGQESLGVTLTLKGDVVTDATVESKAENPQSKVYQAKFISGYKTLVVGKNIADIKLDKVSGSSLTPKGFNDAVAKIETQAKA